MPNVKLVVIYPRPKDVEAFEKVYQNQRVPMAVDKLAGKTKIVATKVLSSPQGAAPFYPIAEVHFSSMQALEACAASDGGKQTLAHAVSISSGGRQFSWSQRNRRSRSINQPRAHRTCVWAERGGILLAWPLAPPSGKFSGASRARVC